MQNGKLVLIRHAEFVKPVPGAYYGQSDLPLTEQGEAQARSLSRWLKAIAPDISRIECSDLKRAVRTAELALPVCQPELNHSLREISFGKWEGRTYAQIKDEPEFSQYAGGGPAPGGESAADFAARVIKAADDFLSQCEGTCAIVAHAGPIRHIIAHMLGLAPDANWRFMVDTASVSVVTVSYGYAYLSALNLRPELFNMTENLLNL